MSEREQCRDKRYSQQRERKKNRVMRDKWNKDKPCLRGREPKREIRRRSLETVRFSLWPTRATEFLALDLSNAFVCKAARAGTAGATGLDGVGAQVVGQPLQVTVTNKWVLGQVTGEQRGRGGEVYWKEEEKVREEDIRRKGRKSERGKKNTHEN